MFCIKCGSQIADGSKFCENCGALQQGGMPQEDTLEKGYEEIVQKNEEAQGTAPSLELPPKTEFEMPKAPEEQISQAQQPTTPVMPVQSGQPEGAQTPPLANAPQQFSRPAYQAPPQQQTPPNSVPAQNSFSGNYQQHQGAPQGIQNTPNGPYQSFYGNQQPPRRKKTGIIIAIVVVVLALAAAAAIFFGGGDSLKPKTAYTNEDELIQAYFQAVQSGDSEKMLALMPPQWVNVVCAAEGYDDADEFLYEYEYATNMGYMGKKVKEYYIEEDYTEYFTGSQVDSINSFYSPANEFDNVALFYVDCRFKDGSSDEFGIYIAEISGNYYIINTF